MVSELVDLVLLIVALCHLLPSVISGQLVLFFSSGLVRLVKHSRTQVFWI
ncbi:hypothetical protein GYH30_016010 [Glycine max]|nr:hypothetical protein GYH30_016010 [Glycine max]